MAKIQIKNSFITSSADITISSSMVKFSSGISAKNITGSFSGSIPALTSYYKQGGNSFGTTAILGTNDNQALILETNNSEKVRVTSDGNVGIGTSGAAYKLDVSGDLNIANSNWLKFSGNNTIYSNPSVGFFIQQPDASTSTIFRNSAGSSLMAVASNGNVGIGTTSPSRKLDVSGSAIRSFITAGSTEPGFIVDYPSSNGYGAFFVHVNGTRRWRIGSVGDTNVQPALNFWQEGTGSRMIINNLGNVGIGTSIPAGNLDVYASGGSSHYIRSSVSAIRLLAYGDGTNWIQSGTSTGASSADLIFSSMSGVSQWMRIQGSSGNVGIGTSSPADKLHVIGNVRINGGDILNWSGQAFIQTLGNYDMFFRPNSTLQMILTGNGNVGIGSGFTNPLAKLHVSGSSTSVSAIFNGNVGIGTTSPSSKLHISNTAAATRITITDDVSNGRSGYIESNYSDALVIGTTSGVRSIRFAPDNSTAMTIAVGTNNVGIGTTNPTQRLDLSGSLRIRSSGTYSDPTDNAGFINYDSSGGIFTISARSNGGNTYMAFRTSNSGTGGERMRIINDGNVGIGTSTPSYLLDVYSGNQDVARFYNNQTTFGFILGSTANTSFTNLLWSTSTGNAQFFKNRSSTSWGGADSFNFYTSNGGFAWHPAGVANAMYLTTSGNLGIGSTSPTSAASFNKVVEAYDATSLSYQVNSGGTYKAEFGISSAGGWLGTSTTHDMRLVSNGTERMRILSGGSIGIGTTSVRLNSLLTVYGSGAFGTSAYGFYVGTDATGAFLDAGTQLIRMFTGQQERIRIDANGNLGIGTTSPVAKLHVTGSAYYQGYVRVNVSQNNTIGTSGVPGNLQVNSINIHPDSTTETMYLRRLSSGVFQIQTVLASANSGSLQLQPYGGNVGIGTTTVDAKLRVLGNVRATSFTGSFSGSVVGSNMFVQGGNSFGTTAILGTSDNQALILETNNSEKLRITTAGNVGIGTSTPTAKLQIGTQTYSTAPDANYFVVGNDNFSGTGPVGAISGYPATANRNQVTASLFDVVGGWEAGNGSHALLRASAYDKITTTPALVVLNNGNVGIGTSTPNALGGLHVYRANSGGLGGYAILDNNGLALANETALMFGDGGASSIRAAISSTTEDSPYYGDIKFKTGQSVYSSLNTRMIIKGNGNVGIGTTTTFAKLVVSNGSGENIEFTPGNATVNGGLIENINRSSGTTRPDLNLFTSNGSNGSIKFYTNGVNERMRVNYDGNVGIGTSSPTTRLHVYGSGGGFEFGVGSPNCYIETIDRASVGKDLNTGYYTRGSGSFTWNNGSYTERMRINGNGNLGIGSSSPAAKLDIVGTNSTIALSFGTTVPNNPLFINTYGGAQGIGMDSADAGIRLAGDYAGGGNRLVDIGYYSSGTIAHANWVSRLRVLNNGNVGIGTTSPICKLNVTSSASTLAASFQGNVGVGNTAGYYYGLCSLVKPTSGLNLNIMYASLSSGYGEILMSNYNDNTGASGWASYIRSYSNPGSDYSSILTFGTSPASLGGPSERMRITAAGYVGIGTSNTTPYSSLFPGQLVIDSGTSNVDGIFVSTNNSNAAELVLTKKNTTNSFGSLLIQHAGTSGDAIVVNYSVNTTTGVSGTNSFKVTTGGDGYFKGNVGIGTTSFVYAAANRGLLEIYGSTDSLISLRNSNNPFYIQKYSTDVYINNTDNGALILNTNNTERARITSVGNVGIGTNNPGYKLDVSGSVFISGVGSKFSGPGSEAGYRLKFYDNGGINNDPGIGLDGAGGGSESMWFNTLNGFYWNMGTNGVKMLLNSSGNLGIGTSTPTSKLHVIETTATGSRIQLGTSSANSLMSSTGVNDFIILTAPFGPTPASTNNNGAKWGIKLNGSIDSPNTKGKAACIYAVSEEPGAGYNRRVGLALHTSPFDLDSVERLRISNDGNVGIGTTSPVEKLDINGNLYFSKASDPRIYAGTGIGLNIDGQALWLNRNTNASIIMVTGGGNVGIGTTGPSSKLHIYDSTYSFTRCTNTTNAGHYVDIGANSSGQSFLFSYGAYPVLIGTNGSERIRVDSGGNVGIGTSSPSTYTTQLAIETSQTRAIMAFNPALADTGTLFGLGFGYAMSTYNSAYVGFYKASSGSSSNRLYFSLWNQDNILNILGSGNVGVGTTAPISKLNTYASGSNLSVFRVDGGNGTLFEVTDQLSGSLFSVNDVSGLPLLEVFSNNRIVAGKYGSNALVISGSSVGIGTTTPAYKLQVNGSFGATTKSFVIDHPTKEGKKLVYGSLESPYHGIRLTGRNMLIDGECKVQLPDYIYKLARPESVNIQITPIKCGKVIYVDEISVENNYFVVKYDKSLLESYKNYEFFWDFTATRSDVEQLVVEQ